MLNRMKIAVIGSSNFDVINRLKRFPEIGETIIAEDMIADFGGKGENQALTIAKLGGDVLFMTCVGDDILGKLIYDNLKRNKINMKFVKVIESQKNGTAVGYGAEKDNILVYYPGANQFLTTEFIGENLKEIFKREIILTQFEIPLESVELLSRSKTSKNVLIVNPSPLIDGKDYSSILKEIDILISNKVELSHLTGKIVKTTEEIRESAEVLLKIGVKNIVVTLGSKGVFVKNFEAEKFIEPREVKVLSTIAAGDIFAGAFAFYFAISKNVIESAIYANDVASISVTKFGSSNSIPSILEIEKFREDYQ